MAGSEKATALTRHNALSEPITIMAIALSLSSDRVRTPINRKIWYQTTVRSRQRGYKTKPNNKNENSEDSETHSAERKHQNGRDGGLHRELFLA